MTELTGLAFLLCSRAKDKRLADEEILWLVGQTIEHMEGMEFRKKLEKEVVEWTGTKRLKYKMGVTSQQ